VPPEEQRRALASLLKTLDPAELAVPQGLLPYLSASWPGNSDRQFDIEIFRTAGGSVFDPLVASDVAAAVTLDALLAPDRLNRLAGQHALDASALGVDEVVDRLLAGVLAPSAAHGAAQRRVATATVLALARTQRDAALSPTVALALDERLHRLAGTLAKRGGGDAEKDWSRALARLLGDRAALDKALAETRRAPAIPPGMPIGATTEE